MLGMGPQPRDCQRSSRLPQRTDSLVKTVFGDPYQERHRLAMRGHYNLMLGGPQALEHRRRVDTKVAGAHELHRTPLLKKTSRKSLHRGCTERSVRSMGSIPWRKAVS